MDGETDKVVVQLWRKLEKKDMIRQKTRNLHMHEEKCKF